MKRILIYLSFLVIISSCKPRYLTEGDVVVKVEQYDTAVSFYYVIGTNSPLSLDDEYPKVRARKGLYNVGDTIRFTR